MIWYLMSMVQSYQAREDSLWEVGSLDGDQHPCCVCVSDPRCLDLFNTTEYLDSKLQLSPVHMVRVNPFPNTPFWDCPKFKETADDNWNVGINSLPNDKILDSSKLKALQTTK